MNEHFLKYGTGRIALNGIIGAMIMQMYNSHTHMLIYAQVPFTMYVGHLNTVIWC